MKTPEKHAWITGGGSGVGAAIATTLAKANFHVTVSGRREQPLKELASKSEKIGWVSCDVSKPESIKTAFEKVKSTAPVDIVIANAGIAISTPFEKAKWDDFSSMMEVNLKGVFLAFQAALQDMKKQEWGRLIAVASTAGLKGYPYTSPYAASKHAVVGLVKSIALELAQTGITTNAVCPGFTETPMLDATIKNIMEKTGHSENEARTMLARLNPMNRFIQPEEVADCVLWLCGKGAGAINGQAIPIDGGEA